MSETTCQHHGLEENETTRISDPERRYLRTCRGCSLQYEEFECGRCGKRNGRPKACVCRKFATGGLVMGPGKRDDDSVQVHISPAEALLPGPNGTGIHIRGAYGDEPMQVTEIDMDDLQDDED